MRGVRPPTARSSVKLEERGERRPSADPCAARLQGDEKIENIRVERPRLLGFAEAILRRVTAQPLAIMLELSWQVA